MSVIAKLRARRDGKADEQGFTLIELMVVVLIIAILVAIAIPTFLGARSRAQDRAAQSDLRNSLLAAEVHYTDNESYDIAAADLAAIEPELAPYTEDMVIAATDFGVHFAETDTAIVFVRQSASGTFFCVSKDEATGTTYLSGALAAVDTSAECNGASW